MFWFFPFFITILQNSRKRDHLSQRRTQINEPSSFPTFYIFCFQEFSVMNAIKKNHNTVKPEWKFSSPFTNAVGVFYAKMKSWTWWYNLVQYREHLWFISALAKSLSKIHLHNAQTVRDFPISLGFSPLLVLLNCS